MSINTNFFPFTAPSNIPAGARVGVPPAAPVPPVRSTSTKRKPQVAATAPPLQM